MPQTAIPFLVLRGGTSRGLYFARDDLPADRPTLAKVLIAAVGAGHPLNVDGLGGGSVLTTKVAMLSRSAFPGADVDFFFAQVGVAETDVDFRPTCGNILAGVGPAALEMGLVPVTGARTTVRIQSVNTAARVEATVETPQGRVRYDGDVSIDGAPGAAAPVRLEFMDVVGSSTGALLPTGAAREVIEGVNVTCIDVAMPMVIARAEAFGLTGFEPPAALDANRTFLDRMERIRREAGRRMGLGDVARAVVPKVGLLAPPRAGGAASARYFTPWTCHPSLAVSGAQCLASCLFVPGAVAEGIAADGAARPAVVLLEHPAGEIEVTLDYSIGPEGFLLRAAGLIRTARLLARGEVYIPARVWRPTPRRTAANPATGPQAARRG